jgi:peptide/nickel transport system substrate-binding protein
LLGHLVLLSLVLAMLACAAPAARPSGEQPQAAQPTSGPKRIVVAIQGDATVLSTALNPRGSAGSIPGVDAVEDLLHAGLGAFNGRDELVPQLAENVPTVENGLWKVFPDGRMETIWKIREGAVWHDGTALTTADLLFTLQVARDRRAPQFWSSVFELIESASAPDARTIVVDWAGPYIDADTLFTHLTPTRGLPLPKHILEAPYLDAPEAFIDLPYWNQGFVGAGPFRLQELTPGSHLLAVANDRYVLGRPKVAEIEVRFVPDANALVTTVLAGAADAVMGARIAQDAALQARDQWRNGTVEIVPSAGLLAMYPQFINPRPALVGDARFRRALLHGLDRQELVDTLMSGLTTVADVFISPTQPEYAAVQSSVVRYPYDPAKAAQQIVELGYVRGADGLFHDAEGQTLAVEVWATDQTPIQPKTLFPVADTWQRLGVGVTTNVVPNQRVTDREYRSTRPAFELLSTSGVNFASFHSSQAPVPQNNFTGNNRSRYRSPELDALIDRYFLTIPIAERMGVLGQIVRHETDQVVGMGVFHSTTHMLVGNRLVNVHARGANATEAWNAHEWDVK